MINPSLVVRVNAAIALGELLDHQAAVDFVRTNLGPVLKVFLEIMDEIDFDQLIHALRKIVEVYGEEVAPYAVSLC